METDLFKGTHLLKLVKKHHHARYLRHDLKQGLNIVTKLNFLFRFHNATLTAFTCTRIMRLFPIIRVRMHYDVYMSRARLLLPFTWNFHSSYYSLRIVVHFFTAIINIPHCTAQIMDSERAGVFTGRCFNLFIPNA